MSALMPLTVRIASCVHPPEAVPAVLWLIADAFQLAPETGPINKAVMRVLFTSLAGNKARRTEGLAAPPGRVSSR